MSADSASTSNMASSSVKPKKVVVPKVWKRPHSTIYGKNVEFGSRLYSDKLGEINGRKFNSELPWQMRNSGTSSTSGSSVSQGYLSKLLNEPRSTLLGSVITSGRHQSVGEHGALPPSGATYSNHHASDLFTERRLTPDNCVDYADVLELTNPNRYRKRRASIGGARNSSSSSSGMMHGLMDGSGSGSSGGRTTTTTTAAATTMTTMSGGKRIDFYENYLDCFNDQIRRMNDSSRLMNDPLMQRRAFDSHLDFNYELGLFVPAPNRSSTAPLLGDGRSLVLKKTPGLHEDHERQPVAPCSQFSHGAGSRRHHHGRSDDHDRHDYAATKPIATRRLQQRRLSHEHETDINPAHFNPVISTTKRTQLLPKHACQLADSPYGQSADGRKLSLGSINPHSYRPSLPHKTTTVHASDGEEFEFQDRSSPFYTDRWAGRTIRHFDSDLYSNANLFKTMIL